MASYPATVRQHILVLGGTTFSLVNFRGPMIRAMQARGHRVTAAAGEPDPPSSTMLADWGVGYEPLRLGRAGLNPLTDFATLVELMVLMRRVQPDVLFGYMIKPVIYGLLAARATRVPHRIAMITGLGYALMDGPEIKRRFSREVAKVAYRQSLRFADRVIFQNPDDRNYFLENGLVRGPEQTALVAGSGVDLDHYAPAPLPGGPVCFLMIARLLRDKGVAEFAAAARIVKREHPEAQFILVGPFDPNPSGIKPAEAEAWVREGIIEYRGTVRDVRPEIAASHAFVLPSYYGEGIPRTILEAMAMSRAIVTTDSPGCRETVLEGRNGFLVPPRDADALATAMKRLARDRPFLVAAGAASLDLARGRFDVNAVNATILEIVEGR